MRPTCHLQWSLRPQTSAAHYTIGGQITPGSQGGHYAQPFVIPSVFAVWNASPDLKLGIAITAPFGARLAYSQDFVGRYQSVVSNLSDVQISLAGAYRINEHLSVGGGPVINFLSVRLTQAVNLGGLSSAFGDPMADSVGAAWGLASRSAPCTNSIIRSAPEWSTDPHPTHRHWHSASRILPIDRRRKPGDRCRLVRERQDQPVLGSRCPTASAFGFSQRSTNNGLLWPIFSGRTGR